MARLGGDPKAAVSSKPRYKENWKHMGGRKRERETDRDMTSVCVVSGEGVFSCARHHERLKDFRF